MRTYGWRGEYPQDLGTETLFADLSESFQELKSAFSGSKASQVRIFRLIGENFQAHELAFPGYSGAHRLLAWAEVSVFGCLGENFQEAPGLK